MRVRRDDGMRMVVMALISAPAIAFMSFDFVFPNVSTPSIERNLMVAFLLSILFGMPPGYIIRRTDLAILTVILYVLIGYVVSLVAYAMPFLFYDFGILFPDLYMMFFIRMTVIIELLFFLGGIVGVIMGQILRESYEKDETSQVFSEMQP